MRATEACRGHFLPKKCLGRRSLRQCRNQKQDNVVLIEVDSDDFGDVIILDVPESFHKKFWKKPKHVINIDDDDDDNSESRSTTYNPNGDTPASARFSPTSAAHSPNGVEHDSVSEGNTPVKLSKFKVDARESDRFPPTSIAHWPPSPNSVDRDSVSRGNTPVKLSKSKRTYSDKNISRNRYGLSSDDGCSSDNDCSDCEFMGESFGKLNELWKQAFFTQSDDMSRAFPERKAGSSAPNKPADIRTEEFTSEHSEHSEPSAQQSNLSNFSLNRDRDDVANSALKQDSNPAERSGQFKRKLDSDDIFDADVPDCPAYKSAKQSTDDVSERSRQCFNHETEESVFDSAKEIAGQCNSSQQDADSGEINEVFIGDNSTNSNKASQLNVESGCAALSEKDKSAGSEDDCCHGHDAHDNKAKSSSDLDFVITDRQNMKESDEYKCAMEEEWASRQQQLQIQIEEVRRLRNKKRAENMRIKVNERRQMERLEEIRETRRKDEENLNLKDEIRLEIRNELHKLERMCGDMSSLLRHLGIDIGGPYPSPKEIQTAYKQACLKFHPDRYSKSDLRQQVEAEEKFKLISNMKNKLLFKYN